MRFHYKYNKNIPVPIHLMFLDKLEEAKCMDLYFLFLTKDSHLNAGEGCFVNLRLMYFEQVNYAYKDSKLEKIQST